MVITTKVDPSPDTYQCFMCKGVFEFGWTDKEAEAEREANGWSDEDCAVVCDDCYKDVMPQIQGDENAIG